MSIGLKPFVGIAAEAYNASLARLNIWDGSVRSGKTINSLMRLSKWVRQDAPPGAILLVGKTERTVKQNVVDPLLDIWGPRRATYSAGLHEMRLFGRPLVIVGANDLRAETKIRGITLAGAYGDEVTTWAEEFFQMLMSRLSVPGAAFLGTTNPDSPAHWLNKSYLLRAAELDLKRWQFRLDDNPNLDPAFVAALKKEYTGLWYKRYIEGLWVVAEGAIYDMLDPDKHFVDDLPPMGTTWVGADYGTTNPTVYLAGTLVGDKGIVIHNEWRYDSVKKGRQKTNPEYSQAWFDWNQAHGYPVKRSYVDPAANSFILQLWRDGDKTVHPGDNAVLDGIRETASLLSTGLLRFHRPSTQGLWDEMASYTWDPKAQERGEDKPMKANDHGPDALRYLVRGSRQTWRRLMRDTRDALPQ